MEKQRNSEDILQSLNFGGGIKHERTETSSVTTGWGVGWDEILIARDIMQNFYDANRKRLRDIRIDEKDGVVSIWAPEAFNLERLFYLGSEKGGGDIGHYGEGFKVAATCLLRDHGVTPVAWSGNQVLVMRISEGTVADTRLRPLVYDFFASEETMTGTMLILPGCSMKLAREIQQGLNHFFYNENPLIGKKLWSSWDNRFSIHASGNTMGHVFYRNLKRGEIEGIPIVLVIDKEYKAIENKISKDRDRNAFGGELMKLFYQTFARSGLDSYCEAIQAILEAAKPCWESGHSLLSAIASIAGYRSTLVPEKTTRRIFGDKYFSRSRSRNGLEHLRYEEVEEKWEREGRIALPGYFTAFGVISAEQHLGTIEKKAKSESMAQNSRGLTPAEITSIRVLKQIVQNICPGIIGVFTKNSVSYTVAKTEAILGELRKGRSFSSHEVFLAEEVFISDFSDALAVFIHEHAHIFGHDGSRSFTDALTQILALVVRERERLDGFSTQWKEARRNVQIERAESCSPLDDADLCALLASLKEKEMRDLLNMIPTAMLKGILTGKAA